MTDYRIAKLIESQALLVRAMINPKDPKGIIFYSLGLTLEGEDEHLKTELCERYKERTWWVFFPPGQMLVINLFGTSIGEPEDCLLDALNQHGVRTGTLSIFKGWMEPKKPSWVDRIIEEKISKREVNSDH